jgi:hypothetical protein
MTKLEAFRAVWQDFMTPKAPPIVRSQLEWLADGTARIYPRPSPSTGRVLGDGPIDYMATGRRTFLVENLPDE